MTLSDFESSVDLLGKWPYICLHMSGYMTFPRPHFPIPNRQNCDLWWRRLLFFFTLFHILYAALVNFNYIQNYQFWSTLLLLDLTIDVIVYSFMASSFTLMNFVFKFFALLRSDQMIKFNSNVLGAIQYALTNSHVAPSASTEAIVADATRTVKRRARQMLAFAGYTVVTTSTWIFASDEASMQHFLRYNGDQTLFQILQSMLWYSFSNFMHSSVFLWYTYNILLIRIATCLLIDRTQDSKTIEEVQNIIRMGKRLEILVDDFNNKFGGLMLADFAVYFLTWLVYSYYAFYWIQFDDSAALGGAVIFCLNHFLTASMLVGASSSMTRQFKDLGAAVGDLRHRLLKSGVRDGVASQLKCMSIKFEGHPPGIAPWDFGSADRTVVVQVFGALATYLVILVQFRNSVFRPERDEP